MDSNVDAFLTGQPTEFAKNTSKTEKLGIEYYLSAHARSFSSTSALSGLALILRS